MSAFAPAAPFVPLAGGGSPHAQTLLGKVLRPSSSPPLRRERLETPDGDFLDLDLVDAEPASPTVFLLHGLEGSSGSGYVREMLRGASLRGWGAVALNFRSCSGEPNRHARSYHSGETGDVLFALAKVRERLRGPLFGAGFSLGGNVLLRLLEETGSEAPFAAAAVMSVPFDLARCAQAIDGPSAAMGIYRRVFLRTLIAKALEKARRHPGLIDPARVKAARTLVEFDDRITAPLHGFRDAAEYYARSSSGPELQAIRVPTLLLSSSDDPLVPGDTLPREVSNPALRPLFTERGGHVGFIGGSFGRPQFWGEAQILAWFDAAAAALGHGEPARVVAAHPMR